MNRASWPAVITLLSSIGLVGCVLQKPSSEIKKPVVETLVSATASWNGDIYAYPKGQAEITLLRIIAPSGFRTPVHTHPQPGIAHVIKGDLECVVKADKTLRVSSGESFPTTAGDVPHYCENIGKQDAILHIFYAGSQGQPVTIPVK